VAQDQDEATELGELLAEPYGVDPYGYRSYQGRYARNQPGPYYYPQQTGAYYGMGKQPMRNKDMAITAGIGLLGAGIERYLKAQEADTEGVRYAEQQLAEAQAELKAPTPKVSAEEKAQMVQMATAPVRTEIEEIKSDVGSYLAAAGRTASVEDVVAARDVGTQALADAPLEAAAIIEDKNLKLMELDEAKKRAAQARADNMVAVLDKVQLQQMKYDQALVGDLVKVGMTAMANKVAQDNRPAMDRLIDKGASMADIEKLHMKATAAGFIPGTRAYDVYMMSHYEGRGGATDKQTRAQKKADSAAVQGQRATPTPGIRELREAEATVRLQDATRKQKPVTGPDDPRLKGRETVLETGKTLGQTLAEMIGGSASYVDTFPNVIKTKSMNELSNKIKGLEANYIIYQTPPGEGPVRFAAVPKNMPESAPEGFVKSESVWKTE